MNRDRPSNRRSQSYAPTRRNLVVATLAALAAPAVHRVAAQSVPASVPPHLAALYEKAKPEGEVSIWAPSGLSLEWIPGEFPKRFPGIKVNVLGDQQMSSRLIAETRAGRYACDVWTFSLGGTIDVQKRGLLEKVDWQALGAKQGEVVFDGEAVMTHNVVFAPNFIKTRLSRDQVPTNWKGMIDPTWTDKLVAATFLLPRLGSYLALEWGLEETERWTRTLMDQRKMLVTTATVTDFLASGERPLAPAETTFGVFVLRKDKYDAAYQIMNLVPVSQFLASVVKNAPHPNAARLLASWLITPEGKMLYEKLAGLADVRSNPDSPLAQEIKAAGSKIIFETLDNMNQRTENHKRLLAIVRGQG